MDPDELKALQEKLAKIEGRFTAEDEARARKAAEDEEANTRKSLKEKFGSLYGNDDDIGELVLQGLRDRGASVESATEEAVRETILGPLAEVINRMATAINSSIKSVTDAIKDQAQQVVEGPAGGELDVSALEEGTMPLQSPDAGAGDVPPPSPNTGAMATSPDMGALAPMADASAPPAGAPSGMDQNMQDPNMMVSDANAKNILSSEDMKNVEGPDGGEEALGPITKAKQIVDELRANGIPLEEVIAAYHENDETSGAEGEAEKAAVVKEVESRSPTKVVKKEVEFDPNVFSLDPAEDKALSRALASLKV